MGLDSGISVRRNAAFIRHYDYFERYDEDWCRKYNSDVDVCYWRKCWNIRNDIFDVLDKAKDCGESEPLMVEDIDAIIEVLAGYTKDNWEYGGWEGSIWTWAEIQPRLVEQCQSLSELIDLMEEDPEIEVYFYDSY